MRAVNRKYGWRPDRADPRDLVYQAARPLFGLPRTVDLRPGCSPVEDQGNLGSCTGNSSVGALEFLERKGQKGHSPFVDLSRLMAYYNGRAIEGTVKQDAGAEIRDVVKGLAKIGTSSELLWPYNVKAFATKPSAAAFKDAAARRITTYMRVVGLAGIRGRLAQGFPVIIGFQVYESFESEAVARTGIMPVPAKGERMLGGHAVLVVGYDDVAGQLIVRNSWGVEWGLKGYFKMPYAFVQNGSLCGPLDAWTIEK